MQPEFKWNHVKAVVGLGNPGAAYQHTLHNAGAMVLRALARSAGAEARRAGNAHLSAFAAPPRKRFSFLRQGTQVFVLPATFMNESGTPVAEALRYFRIKPEELLILHDDADLPLGSFRLGFGRGSAGHRGVQSVITALRTKNFWRLRLGIRPPAPHAPRREKAGLPAETRRVKAGDFVLRRMSAGEREVLKKTAAAIRQSLCPAGDP